MTGGLFWKILLGFWLTLFLIIEGLWLVFVVRPGPTAEEWLARRIAPPVLSELAASVRSDGLAGYRRARAALPPANRGLVTIGLKEGRAASDAELSKIAIGPDGIRYLLHYSIPPADRRAGPLAIPWPILVAGAIAGLAFSILLALYLTRPIVILRDGFNRLAAGSLHVRVGARIGKRRDELAALAADFDVMAARLEQLVDARDRLLHDVSHELRSPLSRMQLAMALVRQDPKRFGQSMDRIEQEMARLGGLVHELLTLARAESGSVSDEHFDPIAVVESVLVDARFEATAIGVNFDVRLPDVPEDERPNLRGSAELLRRTFENVIRNAVRFAPAASYICVNVSLDSSPSTYRFSVQDGGPGVDEADLPTLFDPFVKVDQAGYGLGLAIAKRSIVAHGGTISAQNLIGGFQVAIEIPVPYPS